MEVSIGNNGTPNFNEPKINYNWFFFFYQKTQITYTSNVYIVN